jgi:hypothetical protein
MDTIYLIAIMMTRMMLSMIVFTLFSFAILAMYESRVAADSKLALSTRISSLAIATILSLPLCHWIIHISPLPKLAPSDTSLTMAISYLLAYAVLFPVLMVYSKRKLIMLTELVWSLVWVSIILIAMYLLLYVIVSAALSV